MTPLPAGVVPNGNFELGRVAWFEYSDAGFPIIRTTFPGSVRPHGGAWAAWLGGIYGTSSEDAATAILQPVAVSPTKPYLSYWHWIASADVCGYDVAGVEVDYGAPDPDVVDAFYLCSSANTNGWRRRTIDMHKYVGQTVILIVLAGTDNTLNSNWFLDDFTFESRATVNTEDQEALNTDPANTLPKDGRKGEYAPQREDVSRDLVRRIREQLK